MYGIFTYVYHKKSTIHVGKIYHSPMDPSWVKAPFPQNEMKWSQSLRPNRSTSFFWNLHPLKSNCLNLEMPPNGKGETSTQIINFWVQNLSFLGVYLPELDWFSCH